MDSDQDAAEEKLPTDHPRDEEYDCNEDWELDKYYDQLIFQGNDADGPRKPELNYDILRGSDINRRQEDEIAIVSSILCISKVAATLLLLHYNWRVCEALDAWFADEDRVRRSVGLLKERRDVESPKKTRKVTCTICFETYPLHGLGMTMRSAACGHLFCSDCWEKYTSTSIQDGFGCLTLRCPAPSCGAAVGRDMIESLALKEYNERYSNFLMRSYIENSSKRKWCPAPGCEYAVEFSGGAAGGYDVCCFCSSRFCWNCMKEAHRPVDCGTAEKWFSKNNSEAENLSLDWIFKKTKPCPKCKRPIEKNHGCIHMTCRAPCEHQFCWVCLDPWDLHIGGTGGGFDFYSCYRNSLEFNNGDRKISEAKMYIGQGYAGYYEGWVENEMMRKEALKHLHQMQREYMKELRDSHGEPESHLQMITDAWLQIVECRRVLKWTYAYGYYLTEDQKAKKAFFEYLQLQAESVFEKLLNCEEDIHEFLTKRREIRFNNFFLKLSVLTIVTKTYFENLVEALENDLEELHFQVPSLQQRQEN